MAEWSYDMKLWKSFEDWMFDDDRIQIAPQQANAILFLLGIEYKKDLEILDLCCGIGRHSIALSLYGHKVTGVDIVPEYIERAKIAAKNAGADVDFKVADVLKYSEDARYDIVISMFTSFGFFEDNNDNIQVLKNAYTSLKSGGRILIDVMGKEIIARIFLARDWEERDGIIRIHEREIIDDFTRIANRQIVIDGDDIEEFEFTHWLYSSGELRNMLEEAGFENVVFFGDFTGEPYDMSAQRLIAIARKK